MEMKTDSLENFIFLTAYYKALVKSMGQKLRESTNSGCLDDAELALTDALFIGLAKTDRDFEEVIKHCMERSDKVDHIKLALLRELAENQ